MNSPTAAPTGVATQARHCHPNPNPPPHEAKDSVVASSSRCDDEQGLNHRAYRHPIPLPPQILTKHTFSFDSDDDGDSHDGIASACGQIARVGTFSFDYDELQQAQADAVEESKIHYDAKQTFDSPLITNTNQKRLIDTFDLRHEEEAETMNELDGFSRSSPMTKDPPQHFCGDPSPLVTKIQRSHKPALMTREAQSISKMTPRQKRPRLPKSLEKVAGDQHGSLPKPTRSFNDKKMQQEQPSPKKQVLFPDIMKPVINLLLYLDEHEKDRTKVHQAFGIVQRCFRMKELSFDPEDCNQDLIGSIFDQMTSAFGSEVANMAVNALHFKTHRMHDFFPEQKYSYSATSTTPSSSQLAPAYAAQLRLLSPEMETTESQLIQACEEMIEEMNQAHRDELWVSLIAISMLRPLRGPTQEQQIFKSSSEEGEL